MSSYPDSDIPASFTLPPLPAALDDWFALTADLDDDSELIFDGAILDGLGVVDAESARQALAGYRFVYEDGEWVDAATRGEWNENWIVLDSINADPIIADVSTPEVVVLQDEHGRGRWAPTSAAPSLDAFLAAIERNDDVPGPPPFDDSAFEWSVWAIDLGPQPMRTLLALAKWPLFPDFTRAELRELRTAVPVRLGSGLSESLAQSCVEFGARWGAVFEARRDRDA